MIALTRDVSAALAACELTHLSRTPIDVARARLQHAAYERALRDAGAEVTRLPATDAMPDSVFIEDQALVFDDVAVITRPGAASRRVEAPGVIDALKQHRPLVFLEAPATLDGGDVLAIGTDVYVGQSTRTNAEAVTQLRRLLPGRRVIPVAVTGVLHLKSAVTAVFDDLVLVNPRWVDPALFHRRILEVDPREPHAANVVRVNGTHVFPAAFPETAHRLVQHGCKVNAVDVGELQKAEGAVTCCSLLFSARSP